MTREEAINLESEVVYSLLATKHKEAAYVAFDALREQEERSKGCRWCWNFQKNPKIVISGHGNKEFVVFFDFCPMCGRKLEVEG